MRDGQGSCNQDIQALLFMDKYYIISLSLLCFLKFPNVCSGLFNFSLLHLSNEKVKCNKWITQGHYKGCFDLFRAFNFRAKAWFSVTFVNSNCFVSLTSEAYISIELMYGWLLKKAPLQGDGGGGADFQTPSDTFVRKHLSKMATDENLGSLWSCSSILFLLVMSGANIVFFKNSKCSGAYEQAGLDLNRLFHVPHGVQGYSPSPHPLHSLCIL